VSVESHGVLGLLERGGSAEDAWNEAMTHLEEEMVSAVPAKKLFAVRNLVRSILRCKEFDITTNGSMTVKGMPKTTTPILDYALTATRHAGPQEQGDANFILFMSLLLRSNMPKQFVKNKSLFSLSKTSRRRTLKV
jgi:aspartokinase-like uncharacterized kinase